MVLGGLFAASPTLAQVYDNTTNPSLGSPCVLCNFPPHEYQAGFTIRPTSYYYVNTAQFYFGATATAYTVTTTWTNSLSGATVYWSTTTVPFGSIAPVVFSSWFYYVQDVGPIEPIPSDIGGPLLVPNTTNTVRFYAASDLAIGDYVEGTQVSVSSTDIIKTFDTYDDETLADRSYERAPKLILNGVIAPLPPTQATPGLDPFETAFLGSYGIQSTSTIAEMQAAQSSVTSTCPDIFLIQGACEFTAWLFIPNITDLGSLLEGTYDVASTRFPTNYVVGALTAISQGFSQTSGTATFDIPLTTSSAAVLGLPASSSLMHFNASESIQRYIPGSALAAFRQMVSLVMYLMFIEGCYAMFIRIFSRR